MAKKVFQALTIAGSDSGGGAGIQADLKTFQESGVFGMSVITAITAQNTLGVFDIHTIPTKTIKTQLEAIAQDFQPTAFKAGMLGNSEVIKTVADFLKQHNFGTFVLDTVMVAKGGTPLLDKDSIETLKTNLLPLAEVITPNIPEAESLSGIKIEDTNSFLKAGIKLQELGAQSVIIKGGHLTGSKSTDYIFINDEIYTLSAIRFNTRHTHGTGCSFSAFLTAELAKGKKMLDAIFAAKVFISSAISYPLGIGGGFGPTNHWAYNLHKSDVFANIELNKL